MPSTSYRIWAWGNPVPGGKYESVDVGVFGVAKAASADHPMGVVNEMIACDLGRAVRLPIPSGIIVTRESDQVLHYVSLNFSLTGQRLPPANSEAIARDHPSLACGVVLFDLWIGNYDRHEQNLAYDEPSKSLQLFDHDRALMCGTDGKSHLEGLDDRSIILGHCLAKEMTSLDGVKEWCEKIRAIPKAFIIETVMDAVKLGLPVESAKFLHQFLINRRRLLLKIIKKNKSAFVNVTPNLLSTF